jgi:MoaA/NifB/PqqE/SkfB family radical SAM enzyme
LSTIAVDLRKLARRFAEPFAYALDADFVKPSNVTLSLTNRCNLKCPTCAYWKTPDSAKDTELTLDEMKRVLAQLREWLGPFQIGLTGGEPFLRNEIFELIREAEKLGIRVITVTNGSLLPARRVEQLREVAMLPGRPVELVSLSLNHLDAAKHNETRGVENSQQKIMQALDQLDFEDRPYRLTFSTILMGFNIDHAPDMVRFVRERGMDGITFQILYFESGNAGYEPGWFTKSPFWDSDHAKIDRGMDELIRLKREGFPITNSPDQMEWMRRYLKNPEAPITIPCKVGIANFDIDSDGEVRLCDVMGAVGNVRDTPPRELWESMLAKERRKEIHGCGAACRIKTCNFRRPLTSIIGERLRGG